MDQHGALVELRTRQHANQVLEIVTVDRADVGKAQRLKEFPVYKQRFERVPQLFDEPEYRCADAGNAFQRAPNAALEAPIAAALAQAIQIQADRADISGNGHFVVV